MDRLVAFAARMEGPLTGPLPAEHTYVVSAAGRRWPCHGGAAGGRPIGSGKGSAELAACLGGADGEAGIIYMRTGLCHQIANRILWPADLRVDQAVGYDFSFTLFGDYGRLSWPELDVCCLAHGMDHLLAARRPRTVRGRLERRASRELQEPEAAYVTETSERDEFAAECVSDLLQLVEQRLGGDLDARRRVAIERARIASAREQFDLLTAAEDGRIGADVYLKRFTDLVQRSFAEIDRVLGRADFERVFGGPPEDALAIIDRDAYARAHGLPPS